MTTSMFMLQDKITDLVEEFIENSNTFTLGANGLDLVGLDFRSGRLTVSVDSDFVCTTNPRSIEYYGGWEYIDSDYKTVMGGYTFYDGEAGRVGSVIESVRELISEGWVYDSKNLTFVNPNDQKNQKDNIDSQ